MSDRGKKKRIYWQGWLVCVPLAVLAGISGWWLKRESELAVQEAYGEARGIAGRVAGRLAKEFEADTLGRFFDDRDLVRLRYPERPVPGEGGDLESMYEMAVALAEQDDPRFWEVASTLVANGDGERTAAGLPLVVMTKLLQYEEEPTPEREEELLRSAVRVEPSVVTERILERVGGDDRWGVEWAEREEIRRIDRTGWTGEWFVQPVGEGRRFVRSDEIESAVNRAVAGEGGDEFWIRAGVGGRVFGGGKGRTLASEGSVDVGLNDEEALYAKVRRQLGVLGVVIGASFLISLAGVFQARRAYLRQVELNEAKTNFVSSVSHELRAPVASIRLMADRLAEGKVKDDAKRDEYSGYIQSECRRLSSLIQNVLDVARIESESKEYSREEADVGRLVSDVIVLMRPLAEEGGVVLLDESGAGEVVGHVDVMAVQQAVVNLVDNAIKHSPPGGEVGVACRAEGEWVEVTVRDQGGGIKRDERERVFERFYRSGDELNRETPGAGIGLSLVKHAAEAHGGNVSVEENEGGGSLFKLRLKTV